MPTATVARRLRDTFHRLENQLDHFHQTLSALPFLGGQVFVLPEIEKGKEHEPVNEILPETLSGEAALQRGLQHYRRLFIQQNSVHLSSKAAIRLPGALCFAVDRQQARLVREQVTAINDSKAELAQIITKESGLPPAQRFDFVHEQLKGLITLSAYRSITCLLAPDTINFGWANKQVIKNVDRQELLEKLLRQQQSPRGIPRERQAFWREAVEREIITLRALPADCKLKIRRPVKVQPIARVWYQASQKQVQHPCPSPLLALCAADSMPKLGQLPPYDAARIKHRYKPAARRLESVIPRLHLWREL